MRPSIFVSAALFCLSACGNAVKADAGLGNPVASSGALPASHDDAVADADANTEKRFRLARNKDLKSEDGSLDGKPDATIVVPDARPHATKSRDVEFNFDSSDSISSSSDDPAIYVPSRDSISSSDVGAYAKYNGAFHEHFSIREKIKYSYKFYVDHRTRTQTQVIISQIKKRGREADNDELKSQEGYIKFLDSKCALPKKKHALACA
uniref:Uncharacterized protein n=1 Tax=Peronospora matthiolae TaxID=2874970 RepID=A0AAV1UMR5_9STRA